jgi:hypothetical protein
VRPLQHALILQQGGVRQGDNGCARASAGVEPEAASAGVEPEAASAGVEPEAASAGVEPEAASAGVEPEALRQLESNQRLCVSWSQT